MTIAAEPDVLAPLARHESKSGPLARLVAGAGGFVVLVAATLLSVGMGLIALLGMAVVAIVQRKRGRALTRSGHWVTACATIAAVLLIGGGAILVSAPQGALVAVRQSMDSSSTASTKQAPPAWMKRVYPQYSQAAVNAKPSPTMMWMTLILGAGMVITCFATLLGTLSWGAGMLLGLAFIGRWPGAKGASFEDLVVPVT
jgi:hypothetical protein